MSDDYLSDKTKWKIDFDWKEQTNEKNRMRNIKKGIQIWRIDCL